MLRKYLLSLAVFALAFTILTVSFLESASVKYVFATPPSIPSPSPGNLPQINYQLPYPGGIMPDSPLWGVKAIRDRVWYLFTFDPLKKAELALLFADKRISMSRTLFADKKPELAFSTLTKSEKYIEDAMIQEGVARQKGINTTDFLLKAASATLMHRQIIGEILTLAPEDAKPGIIKLQDYSKNAYIKGRDILNSKGITPSKNPFSW